MPAKSSWGISPNLFALVSVLFTHSAARSQDQAYTILQSRDELHALDLTTASTTLRANLRNGGLTFAHDITWRSDTSEIWTVEFNGAGGPVGVISRLNGSFTTFFQAGQPGNWTAIAWDGGARVFYLADQQANGANLYQLDPASGTTSPLGATGYAQINSMDMDASGALWASTSNGHLVLLNKQNGAAQFITAFAFVIHALAVDNVTGAFYAIGLSGTQDALYELDPGPGNANVRGLMQTNGTRNFDIVDGVCRGQFRTYGTGCAGTGGVTPRIAAYGCLGMGGNVVLRLWDGVTNTSAIVLFGLGEANIPITPSCASLLDQPLSSPVLTIPLLGTGGAGAWVCHCFDSDSHRCSARRVDRAGIRDRSRRTPLACRNQWSTHRHPLTATLSASG